MSHSSQISQRESQTKSCLIIGGGISGLVIATILQRSGIKATVLDKGRGIGGRLATRRIRYSEDIEGIFDYGTQYFSVKDPKFRVWVDEWVARGVVTEWCRGFSERDGKIRYRGVDGTRGIAKYLAKDLEVHTSTRVVKLNWNNFQWLVETEGERQFRGNILVMTPPVPQSLALLDSSAVVIPNEIRNSLERVSYHSCIAVLALLEKPSKIPAPGGIAPNSEALVWLACNYQKDISPQGYAITLHATPEFSQTYWESDNEEIARQLLTAASPWLDSEVLTYQVHRWRYSLPKTVYDRPYLALPEPALIMAGDAFVAPKIEGAVLSGIAAAEQIKTRIIGN